MCIAGKVYDVTEYAKRHPGGNVIYQGAGKDATLIFN
jgi:cytochrome b involved in lipid metabolism